MPEERQKRKEADAPRRGTGLRPLAASLGGVAKRAFGRRGFAEAGLITDWASIVGPELAAACQPERLSFPPGKREGGTLRILVAGGVATELQHMEPMVLDRINGHFGYRAVTRLTLVHNPAGAGKRSRLGGTATRGDATPDVQALQRLDERISIVEDPEIRAALARIGRAILEERARGNKD